MGDCAICGIVLAISFGFSCVQRQISLKNVFCALFLCNKMVCAIENVLCMEAPEVTTVIRLVEEQGGVM